MEPRGETADGGVEDRAAGMSFSVAVVTLSMIGSRRCGGACDERESSRVWWRGVLMRMSWWMVIEQRQTETRRVGPWRRSRRSRRARRVWKVKESEHEVRCGGGVRGNEGEEQRWIERAV